MGMNLRNNALYVCLLKVKNDPDKTTGICGEVLQHLRAFFGMQRDNIETCQALLRELIENWPERNSKTPYIESVNYPIEGSRAEFLHLKQAGRLWHVKKRHELLDWLISKFENDEVLLWPDGSWCYKDEIEDGSKGDDYELVEHPVFFEHGELIR